MLLYNYIYIYIYNIYSPNKDGKSRQGFLLLFYSNSPVIQDRWMSALVPKPRYLSSAANRLYARIAGRQPRNLSLGTKLSCQ